MFGTNTALSSCNGAAVAQGQIVDICPQYLPDPGACWPPNSCTAVSR